MFWLILACVLLGFSTGTLAEERIIVTPFTDLSPKSSDSYIGMAIADLSLVFVDELGEGLVALDRAAIRHVISELEMNLKGVTASEGVSIGKVLGATVLLSGSFTRGPNNAITIRARMTQVADSNVIAASETNGRLETIQELTREAITLLLSQRELVKGKPKTSGRIDPAPLDANLYLEAIARRAAGLCEEAVVKLFQIDRTSPYAKQKTLLLAECFTDMTYLRHAAVELKGVENIGCFQPDEIAKLLQTLRTQIRQSGKTPSLDPGKEPAAISAARTASRPGLAILDFGNLSRDDTKGWLGMAISDLLIGCLSRAHDFYVLDRENVRELLREIRLSASGLVTPETAVRFARFSCVDKLVTGAFEFDGADIVVEAMVIDASTEKISYRKMIRGQATDFVSLARALSVSLLQHLSTGGDSGSVRESVLHRPQPPSDALASYYKGIWLQARGEAADSLLHLLLARKIMPEHGGLYYHMARAFDALGENAHAVASSSAGVERTCDSIWRYRLAQVCADKWFLDFKDVARATAYYDIAYSALHDEVADSRTAKLLSQTAFRMGQCFERIGRREQAIALYEKACRILPEFQKKGKRLRPAWAFEGLLRVLDSCLRDGVPIGRNPRFVHWITPERPSYAGDVAKGQAMADAYYVADQGHSHYCAKYIFAVRPPFSAASLNIRIAGSGAASEKPPFTMFITPMGPVPETRTETIWLHNLWKREAPGEWKAIVDLPQPVRRLHLQISSHAEETIKNEMPLQRTSISPSAMGIQWTVQARLKQPSLLEGNDQSRMGQDRSRIPVYQPTYAQQRQGSLLIAFCDNNNASSTSDIWLGTADTPNGALLDVRRFPLCSERRESFPTLFVRRNGSYLLLWCVDNPEHGYGVWSASSKDGRIWQSLGKVADVKYGYGTHASIGEDIGGLVHAIFSGKHMAFRNTGGWTSLALVPDNLTTNAVWRNGVRGTEVYIPDTGRGGTLCWVYLSREHYKRHGPMKFCSVKPGADSPHTGIHVAVIREGTGNYDRVYSGMFGDLKAHRIFLSDWVRAFFKTNPEMNSPPQFRRTGWVTMWPGAFVDCDGGFGCATASTEGAVAFFHVPHPGSATAPARPPEPRVRGVHGN